MLPKLRLFRQKTIDGPGAVLVPCFQQGGRELGLMDRVRVILGLKAERVAVIIAGSTLTRHLILQEIRCIKLDSGQIRITFQHAAAGRVHGLCSQGQFSFFLIQHPVVVISLSEYQGLKISAYIPSMGVPATGAISPVGMETSSAGV